MPEKAATNQEFAAYPKRAAKIQKKLIRTTFFTYEIFFIRFFFNCTSSRTKIYKILRNPINFTLLLYPSLW